MFCVCRALAHCWRYTVPRMWNAVAERPDAVKAAYRYYRDRAGWRIRNTELSSGPTDARLSVRALCVCIPSLLGLYHLRCDQSAQDADTGDADERMFHGRAARWSSGS